ncbi:MAG: OmpH family outer membrane protein [Deltaproteobacteria bacterium]
MNRIQTLVAVLVAGLISTAGIASAQSKVGFVNLQRAVAESATGKAEMGKFQKEVEKLRAEIEAEQKELEALKLEIERKAVVMKEDERRKLITDFEHKQIDFKRKVEETQVDLQAKNQTVVSALLQKLQQIIIKVGTEGGYTGIFDSGGAQVLFADPASELTDEVIKAFDADLK